MYFKNIFGAFQFLPMGGQVHSPDEASGQVDIWSTLGQADL